MISQGIQGKSLDTLSRLAFLDMPLKSPNPPYPCLTSQSVRTPEASLLVIRGWNHCMCLLQQWAFLRA